MTLFRVFPYDVGAAPNDRGGALFVPPTSGAGRIENPDLYAALYLAAEPHAAVAETFGRIAVWRPASFVRLGGGRYALATINAPNDLALSDLNDIDALRSIGVARPTDVVTRDREITRAWARAIFQRDEFAGARWWSYYNPDWPIVGLWKHDSLAVASIEILSADGVLVREAAAAAIVRQIAR